MRALNARSAYWPTYFPLIGSAVDEVAPGYRRFRFQSHLIFYTAERGDVVIRAVLHAAMDIRRQLFE